MPRPSRADGRSELRLAALGTERQGKGQHAHGVSEQAHGEPVPAMQTVPKTEAEGAYTEKRKKEVQQELTRISVAKRRA